MIVKHIKARPATAGSTVEAATHARQLVDYLRSPEKDGAYRDFLVAYMTSEKIDHPSTERLVHIGARGLVSETLDGQRAEMMAIAQSAKRGGNPMDHWLLSWREGEYPTPDEIDETVAIFVRHLGVEDNACIYACHGDTHNRHLHLALNRYNAETGRMTSIANGWFLEAAHEAVALIVDRFGWQAEENARYVVMDGQPLRIEEATQRRTEGSRAIGREAAAYENRTGYRSMQRIAQEEALPIINKARSWVELHERLAAQGMAYDPVGRTGAVIVIGEEGVKASRVHRQITRDALSARLGAFEPRAAHVMVSERNIQEDRLPEAFRAEDYLATRQRWQASRDEKQAQPDLGPNPTALAIARAAAKARKVPKESSAARPAPDLESFYYDEDEDYFAARWRKRRKAKPMPCMSGVIREASHLPSEIDGFRAYRCVEGVRYARDDEGTAFIVRDNRIDVAPKGDEAILAALRVGAAKFKGLSIAGDDAFRNHVYAIAVAHGLGDVLIDPDLIVRRQVRENKLGGVADQARAVAETLSPLKPVPIKTPTVVEDAGKFQRDREGGLRAQSAALSLPSGASMPKGPKRSEDQRNSPNTRRGR